MQSNTERIITVVNSPYAFQTRNRNTAQLEVNSTGQDVVTVNGQPNGTTNYSLALQGGAVMVDQTHPGFFVPWGKDVLADWGGPLDLIQVRHNYPVIRTSIGNTRGSYVQRTYTGDIHAQPSLKLFGGFSPEALWLYAKADSTAARWGLGATAIDRCKPAKPQAAFGQFLAELLHDGIPSLLSRLMFRTELEAFQSLGKAYLNVEFGWKLFVADIQDTARALLNQTKILEDLTRNSGKRMRRQYVFPESNRTSVVSEKGTTWYPWPVLTAAHWSQAGARVTTTKDKRTWFAGEFVYRVPDFNGLPGLRAKARQLLGVELTPSYLWQIAPWTWLADWFANVGDMLSNLASISEDDLVIRYAYLMQEASHRETTTHYGCKTNGFGAVPDTIEGYVEVTHKTRLGASPYGFGISWESLSLRQTTILAALGITRASRHL